MTGVGGRWSGAVRGRVARSLVRGSVLAAMLAAVVAASSVIAENVDPAATNAQYAWSENAGWINAEPSGNGGPGAQVSGTDVTGYFWGENIGWINLSCLTNGTCATANYGIKNDGAGNLRGYAWSENDGWISFSCQNNSPTCGTTGNYGVHISPTTGEWSGYAWGENIGWINFGHAQTASRITTDDGDGVPGASDNCPFDTNASQTNTDVANAAVFPGADALGDVCDPDDDGDGCTDVEEGGATPLAGGDRDPLVPWDFYDVPVPALSPGSPNSPKSRAVAITDVLAIISYSGTSNNGAPNSGGRDYDTDLNGNGVDDGSEYDRAASTTPGKLWRTGPPSGGVSLIDVLAAISQVGTVCIGPPA